MTYAEINAAVADKIQRRKGLSSSLADNRPISDYCRSLEAAWEIIDCEENTNPSLKNSSIFRLYRNGDGKWSAWFNGGNAVSSPSAAMAICLAFLNAK